MLQTFWIVGCDNPEWGVFIFPPALKRQLPSLQGNRFCYLSLTALPVDYKALEKEKEKKEHTLLGSSGRFIFPLASLLLVLKQRHLMKQTPVPGKRKKWFKVPFAQESSNTKLWHLFSSCVKECAVSRHQLCRALPNPLWFYLYIFPYFIPVRHCCIGVAASDQMLQVLLWTPGQAPPLRTKPIP